LTSFSPSLHATPANKQEAEKRMAVDINLATPRVEESQWLFTYEEVERSPSFAGLRESNRWKNNWRQGLERIFKMQDMLNQ
jgi:hypothetical protein